MWFLKSLWKERKDFLVCKVKDDCERKQMHEIYDGHFYFYYNREVQGIESDLKPD